MRFKDVSDPKILWGVLFGIILALIVYLVIGNSVPLKVENHNIHPVYLIDSKDSLFSKDNPHSKNVNETIDKIDSLQENLLNERNIYNEKISSINQRFDDLYAFGAIVITLLLLINISVAVRAKNETKQYLDDNFKELETQINQHLGEAKRLVGEIQTEHDLSQKQRKGTNEQKGE